VAVPDSGPSPTQSGTALHVTGLDVAQVIPGAVRRIGKQVALLDGADAETWRARLDGADAEPWWSVLDGADTETWRAGLKLEVAGHCGNHFCGFWFC
jgi:hypothetical protein